MLHVGDCVSNSVAGELHGALLVLVMWHTIRHITGSADTRRPRISALSGMPCAPNRGSEGVHSPFSGALELG